MKARISQKFFSFQGEGKHTGRPSVWIRFFGCPLECNGFGQEYPTKPETWELPYQTIDVSTIKKIEDLPVFDKGCDSAYSWSAKFKEFVPFCSVDELYEEVVSLLPNGSFEYIDLCLTGGEPMLWQKFIMQFMDYCQEKNNVPERVQIETSGYTIVTEAFLNHGSMMKSSYFWSFSPKLYNVSGEYNAIRFDNIKNVLMYADDFQLKFVMNNNDAAWEELKAVVDKFKPEVREKDIFVMPVGATTESHTNTTNKDLASICDKAIALRYNVSGRVHANYYGNAVDK